jgi:oxalate decarboxylase/phosphoglucose isomerase-like protein (cupin superfamily)
MLMPPELVNLLQVSQDAAAFEPYGEERYPFSWRVLNAQVPDSISTLMRMSPGAVMEEHYHRAGVDIFLVLSGDAVLTTAALDEQGRPVNYCHQPLRAGDFYHLQPLQIHSLRNVGAEDLVWLNIAPANHAHTADDYIPIRRSPCL